MNNRYAELIISQVEDNEKLNKKLQLYYAVKETSWQCPKCYHYYGCIKTLVRHKEKSNCLDPKFETRNNYAKDTEGNFFCYFGCTPSFNEALDLERHLLGHDPDELKCWGISH